MRQSVPLVGYLWPTMIIMNAFRLGPKALGLAGNVAQLGCATILEGFRALFLFLVGRKRGKGHQQSCIDHISFRKAHLTSPKHMSRRHQKKAKSTPEERRVGVPWLGPELDSGFVTSPDLCRHATLPLKQEQQSGR